MDLAKFREYCLSKPHATEGTPFGPDTLVFKVGGKMFALASLDEIPTTANLKCDPDLALELRDRTGTVAARAFRDARLQRIGGGTDEIMNEVIAKRLGLYGERR